MTELFGEALLRRRFTTYSPISPPTATATTRHEKAESENSEETVPGTVVAVDSQQAARQRQRVILKRRARKSTEPNNLGVNTTANTVRFAADVTRTSSMMSHATFVLDNDRRRPLIVPTGFSEGNNNKIFNQFFDQKKKILAVAAIQNEHKKINSNNNNAIDIINTHEQVEEKSSTPITRRSQLKTPKRSRSRNGGKNSQPQ